MKHTKDHAACSGCSLCLLVCPMWRRYRDISLTAHGYAKALQHGATAADLAAAVWSCTLCAACDPVCPEQIDVTGIILNLRRQLVHPQTQDLQARMEKQVSRSSAEQPAATAILLPAPALREHPDMLARIAALLKVAVADDDGADIVLALETGVTIPPHRLKNFLAPLQRLNKIIVAEGLLLKRLRLWLPETRIVSLGEALSSHAAVRSSLCASDLYVIEPRAYHADYQRLVKHYDDLRAASGSVFNLDLQRIAIPATARNLPQHSDEDVRDDEDQARWLLHGRKISRIVVESMADRALLAKVSGVPVVHLAELAD